MISAARAGAGFWFFGASIGVAAPVAELGRAETRPSGGRCFRKAALAASSNLSLWYDLVDEAELQSFLRRIEFAFQDYLRGFLRTNQCGRRVAPPHAGTKPSVVSGRPMRVAGASYATRWSQASVISPPPPAQAPWIAATVGIFSPASRLSDLVKSHLARLLKPANGGVDLAKDKWDKIHNVFEESQADLSVSTFIHHFWLSRYEYTSLRRTSSKR